MIPQYNLAGREGTPADVRELLSWLTARGARPDLDVIVEDETPAGDRAATTALATPWAEAGCTWWLETRWEMRIMRRTRCARYGSGWPPGRS